MNKIGDFIEKIGKRNFILIAFILCIILISSLYSTFSLSTISEGTTIINNIKTLKFVLGEEKEVHTAIIAGGSSKNIAITITNKENVTLKYGVYYSSTNDLKNVDIGYNHNTEHLPEGIIKSQESYVITIRVENNTDDVKMIDFGISYGLENGGELTLGENQKFLKQKLNFPLNEVEKGSFVTYIGNNGCTEEECLGENANDVEKTNKGFCGNDTEHYKEKGWRVAYVKKGSAYLISSGAPECIEQEKEDNNKLLEILNNSAEKYCNMDYAFNGICNKTTVWSLNTEDFNSITNKIITEDTCLDKENSKECGYEYDLINTGSTYWISSILRNQIVYYQGNPILYTTKPTQEKKGLRPILKLAPTIVVTKGTGTKEDPYVIKNTVVPNYEYTIVYNGNGATDGDTGNSVHKTNKLQKLNKNNFKLTYQIKQSEFATFDDSYCDEEGCHETSIKQEGTQEAKFLGWSLYSDDKEPMYKDEEEVINLSPSSSDIIVNLYAIWEYTALKLPSIQQREGYEILGWYTEKDGGEKVGNPNDDYTVNEKVTLYARWQKKSS